MERNNQNEDFQDELRSLSEAVFSDDDETDVNPSQEIFGAQSSSLSKEESDARNYSIGSYHKAKRQRTKEDREKREQVIKEKLDILLRLITPNPPEMDQATTLDFVVENVKYLEHQKDVVSKVYTDAGYLPPYYGDTDAGYLPPYYGAPAPLISPYANPWGYYAPPYVPQQYMPFIPQFPQPNPFDVHHEPNSFDVHQEYDTTQSDETQL